MGVFHLLTITDLMLCLIILLRVLASFQGSGQLGQQPALPILLLLLLILWLGYWLCQLAIYPSPQPPLRVGKRRGHTAAVAVVADAIQAPTVAVVEASGCKLSCLLAGHTSCLLLSLAHLFLLAGWPHWQDGTETGGDVANDNEQGRDNIFLNHALPKPL